MAYRKEEQSRSMGGDCETRPSARGTFTVSAFTKYTQSWTHPDPRQDFTPGRFYSCYSKLLTFRPGHTTIFLHRQHGMQKLSQNSADIACQNFQLASVRVSPRRFRHLAGFAGAAVAAEAVPSATRRTQAHKRAKGNIS